MTHRTPVSVIAFSFLSFGIYYVYWLFQTTEEMNARNADVPTAWLSFVPFVNVWWLYRWCQGVQSVTRGSWSATGTLAVSLFVPGIAPGIIQSAFNKVGPAPLSHGTAGHIRAAA